MKTKKQTPNPVQVARVLAELKQYEGVIYDFKNGKLKTDNYPFALKFSNFMFWTCYQNLKTGKNEFLFIVEKVTSLKRLKKIYFKLNINQLINEKTKLKTTYYNFLKSKLNT